MRTAIHRVNICNIPVDALTMKDTLAIIDDAVQNKKCLHHVVINSAKVVNAQKDTELFNSIINCDIINADGQSIVWASRLLKKPVPERVAGIDLMESIIKLAFEKKYSIYFLGANDSVLNKVVSKVAECYNSSIIAGFHNGFYKKDEELAVAKKIKESRADILFVAISSPKKEVFLNRYKNLLNIPFIMGVGGSFDVYSGKIKRAPLWMQQSGLEWFFRVLQEPRRMWKRYFTTNLIFIYLVIREKFFQN